MKDFLLLLVEGIMDAIEEFFNSIVAPSTRFTMNAFLYSLGFTAFSVVAKVCEIPCFVSWQEATTCSVLMLVIVLIDGSARGKVKKSVKVIKEITTKFSYSGEEEELYEEDVEDESDE